MIDHIKWGGGTYVMESVHLQDQHYRQEMIIEKQLPADQLPTFLHWFITDGQTSREADFRDWLASQDPDKVLIGCIVLGYGDEYRATVRQWQGIADTHPNVKVWGVNGSTDFAPFAKELIALAE
jgi:hypothetical protein